MGGGGGLGGGGGGLGGGGAGVSTIVRSTNGPGCAPETTNHSCAFNTLERCTVRHDAVYGLVASCVQARIGQMLIWQAHRILHALQGSLMGPSNNQDICHALRNATEAIMATLCIAHLIVNGGVELAGSLTSIVGLCLSYLEAEHCRGVGLHHQDLQRNTLPLSLIPPSISQSWICVEYSEACGLNAIFCDSGSGCVSAT